MTPAYIALGSNLGNPELQLREATTALDSLPESRLLKVSSLYRSLAVGPGRQPGYLNAVALMTTDLPPITLLDALQDIEHQQGRVRDVVWEARTLDLDLLLYGDVQIESLRLTVPHPRMQQRNFVLYPLREISDTNLALPNGTKLDTLLQQCPADGLVKTPGKLYKS